MFFWCWPRERSNTVDKRGREVTLLLLLCVELEKLALLSHLQERSQLQVQALLPLSVISQYWPYWGYQLNVPCSSYNIWHKLWGAVGRDTATIISQNYDSSHCYRGSLLMAGHLIFMMHSSITLPGAAGCVGATLFLLGEHYLQQFSLPYTAQSSLS